MKTLFPVLALLLTTNAFAAAKPVNQCEARAIELVKALETVNSGAEIVKQAQIGVTDRKSEEKKERITVQAFALNGEDSDTYNEWEVVLRKFKNGKCYSMESMTLTGEN